MREEGRVPIFIQQDAEKSVKHGHGFCVVGSRVLREIWVADFAMSGWVEMAQMRGYLSAGTVRRTCWCGRCEVVCWQGVGWLPNKNAADMIRPQIKWR